MKKILIISDTHRSDSNMKRVIQEESPLDMILHLGDAEGSEDKIAEWANEGCEIHVVRGNNDFFSPLERDLIVELGPHRIFMTHGHYYQVSFGIDALYDEAAARGCDIAMFGHIHKPYLDTFDGITILNPGSLSYPRQTGHQPSYMIMDMDANGHCQFHLYFLGREE